MSEEIIIDGRSYISSKRASELSGYSQDYIGQLSRSGQIEARRVGGLWYISADSLEKHKEKAESYNPAPPLAQNGSEETDTIISFDGKGYVSAAKAAKLTGYAQDYVGQLARGGGILARQIGNRWYVDRDAILAHKENKDSLLAAVQAESVGLKHREEEKSTPGDDTDTGPFLEYTSDDRELMPIVKNEEKSDERGTTRDEAVSPPIKHSIPIHIVQRKMPVRSPEGSERKDEQRKSSFFVRIPAKSGLIAVAIVLVLSLGVVSLNNSRVYTTNEQQKGDTRVQIATAAGSSGPTEMAGATKRFIDNIGAFLEEHFVPELTYKQL